MSSFASASPSSWPHLRDWFDRIHALFTRSSLSRRVFGRAADVVSARDVRSTITSVALMNLVLAGIPGKLGVGVVLCQAMELWMAWRIARHVGARVQGPESLFKQLLSWSGAIVLVMQGMRLLINALTTAFSFLPFSPIALAELVATDFMGVVFRIGFEEMARTDSFRLPKRSLLRVGREAKDLLLFQKDVLFGLLTPRRLKSISKRFGAYVKGDVLPAPTTTMDSVAAVSMASLVAGEFQSLEGPLGRLFVQSVRDLYPDLASADLDTIRERMAAYSEAQLPGVLANLKGRLFERMVEARTNDAGIAAELHADRTHPSTDLVVHDVDSGESFAVSLKATDYASYVEHALARYPDDPIWATDEVAEKLHDPRVHGTGLTNHELEAVTKENFDRLLEDTQPTSWDHAHGVLAGRALGAAVQLWPFCVARLRGRIDDEQWRRAMVRVLGKQAVKGTINFAGVAVFGPLYVWYLLARLCLKVANAAIADASR